MVVRVDVDDGVEDLVELPLDVVGYGLVHLVAVFSEGERVAEVGEHVVVVGRGSVELVLDACEFLADASLLFLEEVGGEGVLVVELEELALLLFERRGGALELCHALALLRRGKRDFLAEVLLELGALFVGQPVVRVEVLDLLLDLVDQDGFEIAVSVAGASPDADEVRVELARARLGHLNDEARSAASTHDGGLQEVGMDAVVLAVTP
nr:hypothetical protein [Sanguibacter hominis]